MSHEEVNLTDTVKVSNDLPRGLTFHGGRKTKGKALTLAPGVNEVDAEVYADKSQESGGDPLLLILIGENKVRYEQQPAIRLPPQGDVAIPTSHVRPPEQKPEPEDPAPSTPIAPTRQGGGVPGNVTEAKEYIAAEGDLDRLNAWLDNESRVKVKRALRIRIGEIGIGNESDA